MSIQTLEYDRLVVSNGVVLKGKLVGAMKAVSGELVFQTGMVGYLESLTDPSYKNQILVLTYPMIGNYGVVENEKGSNCVEKIFESNKIQVSAVIVAEVSETAYNYDSVKTFTEWLSSQNVPLMTDVDTRLLTKIIRNNANLLAKIVPKGMRETCVDFYDTNAYNLVQLVTRKIPNIMNPDGSRKILLVDCGVKNNVIRILSNYKDFSIHIIPFTDSSSIRKMDYDGLLLSSGPGDPQMCTQLIDDVKFVLSSEKIVHVFGICLGHQIMALANGFSTYKLKYGHRGQNQPILLNKSVFCRVSCQNHGFAVDSTTLNENWQELFINANDLTNEGICHKTKPFFSVQFHPEHASGPRDMEFLFTVFFDSICKSWDVDTCFEKIISSHFENESNDNMGVRSENDYLRSFAKEFDPYDPRLDIDDSIKCTLILGSGGLIIGQAGEFDYSGSQALLALKDIGIHTVLINPNIATVQTTSYMADDIYSVPLTLEFIENVIKERRPDGILITFGGQTALNCGIELDKADILNKYKVRILGTPLSSIIASEDRGEFSKKMNDIGERTPDAKIVTSVKEAIKEANKLGYPIMLRSDFTLGGLGSGFAHNDEELQKRASIALEYSPQIQIVKSLVGWREVEYEVIRDVFGNCVVICNMENFDPVGIHTGESIVVAPSQTITSNEYHMLRSASIKIASYMSIIGECNVQFALDPYSNKYYVIEMNARLSRSSALASKATGYPIAYIAALLALGVSLPSIRNKLTLEKTTANFEPSLDYCVVKIPRWDMNKFCRVSKSIGTAMKSVGEVMAIDRSFEAAIQKALRMSDSNILGFDPMLYTFTKDSDLKNASSIRIFLIASALYQEKSIDDIHNITKIGKWFLYKLNNIIDMYKRIEMYQSVDDVVDILFQTKKCGFSDKFIATILKTNEAAIFLARENACIYPVVRKIDTVAGEWPAPSNYLYLTYSHSIMLDNNNSCTSSFGDVNGFIDEDETNMYHDVVFDSRSDAILVLGSGVYRIGSSVEFDWCAVSCVNKLREMKYKTIMINYNPETVSTDYNICDRLYFEEISLENVCEIYRLENPLGVIISMGGQQPNNIAMDLYRKGLNILGTSVESIDMAENRFTFSRMLDEINIKQPMWKDLTDIDTAITFAEQVGYPVLVRPSYVLSGAAMNVVHCSQDMQHFLKVATTLSPKHPVVISKYVLDAKEIDVDIVACQGVIQCYAVSEHIEQAGIHSGDATFITPPQRLNKSTLDGIHEISSKIVKQFHISGPFNMQLLAKNNQLQVIECNLRVSRSFPFVSKVYNKNFISIATKAIMKACNVKHHRSHRDSETSVATKYLDRKMEKLNCKYDMDAPYGNVEFDSDIKVGQRIGVKVPVFSYSRLIGCDIFKGVEMNSTGEVATFSDNVYEAYLKSIVASGIALPKKNIFISIGSYKNKTNLINSMLRFKKIGFNLYASIGTADFYGQHGIDMKAVEWPHLTHEQISFNDTGYTQVQMDIIHMIEENDIDFILNIPTRDGSYRASSFFITPGYKMRQMATEKQIPVFTDVRNIQMLSKSLTFCLDRDITKVGFIDVISSSSIIRLPGFIDIHVHVREPGGNHKEDYSSATASALAGGVTIILAMPNTNPALTDISTLSLIQNIARKKARCDYGLYLGASESNVDFFMQNTRREVLDSLIGMKMYLNDTFTTLKLDNYNDWMTHVKNAPLGLPICVHAEGQTMAAIILIAKMHSKPIHVCHVSTKCQIELIKLLKDQNYKVTCEVCPHHLLSNRLHLSSALKGVKPPLNSLQDVEALWNNLSYIDCFASDHAPHTLREKEYKQFPGFPGVETMLPLMLTEVNNGRLKIEDVIAKMYTNPKKIFNIPDQPDTFIEVDMSKEWIIEAKNLHSKCNWTPYEGLTVQGKVTKVVLRNVAAFVNGKVLAQEGFGKEIIVEKNASFMDISGKDDFGNVKMITFGTSDMHSDNTEMFSHVPDLIGKLPKLYDNFLKNCHLINVKGFNKSNKKVLGLIFFECSTRTRNSFACAMYKLGGSVLGFDEMFSSVKKGESHEDTINTMKHYCDCLVIRHSEKGFSQKMSKHSNIPIINAGDGIGEHPTQALIDLYTIRHDIGTINGLTITIVGDLKHSRTIHSLVKLLCIFRVKLRYVHMDGFGMPSDLIKYLEKHNIEQSRFTTLEEAIDDCDVLYCTRMQRERYTNENINAKILDQYVVTPKLMFLAKDKMIVMHPLPRCNEIDKQVDNDNRAAYFRQVEYGLYVRMSLLSFIMDDTN